jgi:hypothetical protein
VLDAAFVRTRARNALGQPRLAGLGAPPARRHQPCLKTPYSETPVGVEPTSKLLCRQPPCRLAPASYRPSVLARNRTGHRRAALVPRPSQGRMRSPAHPEDVLRSVPRRGIEPATEHACRAASERKAVVPEAQFRGLPCVPAHSQGNEPISIPTWSRTRTSNRARQTGVCRAQGGSRLTRAAFILAHRSAAALVTFGRSDAIRYTIETNRADDWIRTSMGRFTRPEPFCFRATSAVSSFSTSARSRTPCDGFGGHLLSQEHTRIGLASAGPKPAPAWVRRANVASTFLASRSSTLR